MLTGYEAWSNALLETSNKHFGQAHVGKINVQQFETDFRTAMSKNKKQSVSIDDATKQKLSAIKPWKASEESLESYLQKNGASTNVQDYILRMNDHIEKVVRANSEMSDADLNTSISKVIKLMEDGIVKIEEEALNDKNLEEQEVVSILAATCSVQGMSKALSASAQMFFNNLSASLTKASGIEARCWICRVFKTAVNIITTVVVSVVTFVWNTIVFGYHIVSDILEGNGWEGLGFSTLEWLYDFGNFFVGTFGWLGGDYNCYLSNDAWNCP